MSARSRWEHGMKLSKKYGLVEERREAARKNNQKNNPQKFGFNQQKF